MELRTHGDIGFTGTAVRFGFEAEGCCVFAQLVGWGLGSTSIDRFKWML